VFPGEERQLGLLRRWLASLLPDCPARDDVAGVATELGANAIKHTASGQGGRFAIEITWYGPVVRVAVADSGAPGGPRLVDDPDSEHGRGLLVVCGLSVRTGVCGDDRGRLVWADIPWADPGPPVAQDPYEAAIRDDEASLASRFDGIPAWFGRSTLQWWALAGHRGLVSAPTAQELATALGELAALAAQPPPASAGVADAGAPVRRETNRDQRPGLPAATSPSRRRDHPPDSSDAAGRPASSGYPANRDVGMRPRRSRFVGPVTACP
jgi:hypothetical protein